MAGQAAGPLEKSGASQNCPQLYQGESGGLEPAMKPMAGQAGAPRGRGPSAEGPPLRGRSALTGGPVPPCAPIPPFGRERELKRPTGTFLPFGIAQPSGGDFNLRNGVEQIASQRGPPRPRSIFGHFLLIKKVATSASGFCLTNSQITNITHGTS